MTGVKNITKGTKNAIIDTKLSNLVNALLSINTDKLVIVVGQDDVGIAKDATLQLSGQAGFTLPLSVPSGEVFQIPEEKEVIVTDALANGDIYVVGDLLVL